MSLLDLVHGNIVNTAIRVCSKATNLSIELITRHNAQSSNSDAFCHIKGYGMRARCPSSFRESASVVPAIWDSWDC